MRDPHRRASAMVVAGAFVISQLVVGPRVADAASDVGTSTAVDPTAADRSPHLFAMSDGARVALFYDGGALVYRIRPSGGAWGASVTLRGSHQRSVWTRNGEVLYGGSAGPDGTFFVWKLTYAAGAITVTAANPWSGASDGHPFGIYYDPVNDLVHVRYKMDWCCGGQELQAFRGTTLAFAYGASPIYQPSGGEIDQSMGLAGAGGGTFFYGGASGTAFTFVRVEASGTGYTQTSEVGLPELDAAATGGALVWAAGEILYFVNEADQKLRLLRRHAQDTYRLYDLVSTALGAGSQPAVTRRGGTDDLTVLYRDNSDQPNGEVRYVARTSGIWGSAAVVAGGSSTGFGNASASVDDANDAGTARVLYRSGTTSPFVVREDAVAFATAPSTFTVRGTVTSAATGEALAGVPVTAYRGGGVTCCQLVSTVLTDASGAYALALPAGTYRSHFQTPLTANEHGPTWYGGTSFATAADLTVASDLSGVDAALPSSPAIASGVDASTTDKESSPHIFVMSDGAKVVIYRAGNATYYRIRTNGTWSVAREVAEWFRTRSVWTRGTPSTAWPRAP